MTTNELIEHWKLSESPEMNFYDAIDILDNSISEIRSGVPYTDEQLLDLRGIHLFTIQISLGISSTYQSFDSMNGRKTFHDLSYLISKYELPCISGIENEKVDIVKKNTYGDCGIGYKDTDTNALKDIEERIALFKEQREYLLSSTGKTTDHILYTESDSSLDDCITSLGLISSRDIYSCYFYIPEIRETDLYLNSALSKILQKAESKINQITKLIDALENQRKKDKQIKKANKLVKTNNNQSNVVFGRTREKMIAEAKKTHYYLTTLTPDRIKSDQAYLVSKWAKETVFKTDKKVMGSLAVMKRVKDGLPEEQTVMPVTSSPVGYFDWDIWSIVHSNLKDHINEKVDINHLTKSFSISDRQKKENEYSKAFISSISLLSNTWIIYRYNEGIKEVTFAEPLLSCNLAKERDRTTGEEKEFFILTSVCKFYERAEQLNQVMSFDEKLFKIEYYDKNGILVKLAHTPKNMTLITHLLEHIYKFKYYYENPRKNKDATDEDDAKRYKKIKFDTLFDLVEVNNRKSKLSYGRKVEGCFQYWKSLNYIDCDIVKKASQRGKSYDYILLKYPEAPEDTPKLSS